MAKLALLSALFLLPALAAAHPPQHKWVTKDDIKKKAEEKKKFGGKFTSWGQAEGAIKDAEKDLHGDERECSEATREYDHKAFGGGRYTAGERDSARFKKQSACNKVMGTETKLLNALNDADKFLDFDLADAQEDHDSARIAANQSHQKYVAELRGRHQMGHSANPHKH